MTVRFIPLANINGKPGEKGAKGDTGTFAGATAVSVPAGDPAEVSLSGPESAKVANFKIPRGLPGTNGVESDEAMATYIAALDTQTRAALEGVVVMKDTLVFNAADHGVVGNGTADDTAALQALVNAVPDSAVITAPPGSVIRTTGVEVPAGKSMHFDFASSVLVKAGEAPIVRAEGSYDARQSVGGVVNPGGKSGSVITVTDGSVYRAGDVVKVYAQDPVPGTRIPGDGRRNRVGQIGRVVSVSGNEVRLAQTFIDTYTDDIRIARYVPQSVTVRFREAYAEAGTGSGHGYPMFLLRSLIQPTLEGTITRTYSAAIGVQGCLQARVKIAADGLPTDSGYILVSGASESGTYDITAGRCRHAYTDANPQTLPNSSTDPANYGRPMFDRVTGSSTGATGYPWDTHQGGYGHTFHDIIAHGSNGDQGSLFGIRGERHTFINCKAISAFKGFAFYTEGPESSPGGETLTWGHRLVNCETFDVVQPLTVIRNTMTQDGGRDTLSIEGGRFEFSYQPLLIGLARVFITGTKLVYTGLGASAGGRLIEVAGGTLRGDFTIEGTAYQEGATQTMIIRATNRSGLHSQVDVDMNVRFGRMVEESVGALIDWGGASTTGQVRAQVYGRLLVPLMTNPDPEAYANSQSVILRPVGSNTGSSSALQGQKMDVANEPIVHRSGDAVVNLRLDADTAITAGEVGRGAFPGQELRLYVRGAGSVNILNGSAYNTALKGGTSRSMSQGGSMTLVWDRFSNLWVEV